MPSKEARRDAGTGGLYQRASDGMWVGSVSLPEGADGKRRRRYVYAVDKANASRKLRELRRELDQQGDLPTSSVTLTKWIDEWLVIMRRDMRPTSWTTYRRQAAYIQAAIGKRRLDRISADDVRRLHDYLTVDLGLAQKTVANIHGVLVQALKAARAEGKRVPDAPLAVKRPKQAAVRRPSLTAKEARGVLEKAAPDPDEFIRWSLALLLGMRQGECLGLLRDEIDLDGAYLDVSWQLQRLRWEHDCGTPNGRAWPCGYSRGAWCPKRHVVIPKHHEVRHLVDGLWLMRPKTDTGLRRIPLPAALVEALRRYMEATGPGDHGLLLHRDDGRPWEPDVDRARWHAALERADAPSVPLHGARHTTASLLRELGVEEDVRMQILGHANAEVTAGYTHLGTAESVDAMGRLGKLLLSAKADKKKGKKGKKKAKAA